MKEIKGIENIIEQGMLIQTKKSNGNEWVVSTVLSAYGDFIEIKYVEEFLVAVLIIEDILDCRIVSENQIHLMMTEVYNVKVASRSIVLRVLGLETLANVRKHKRYDVYLCGSFRVKDNFFDNYCVVLNISMGGFSIISRSILNEGDVVEITICYKNFHCLVSECVVKWVAKKGKNYLYGLSMLNMEDKSKKIFQGIIKSLQKRESELLKNESFREGNRLFELL